MSNLRDNGIGLSKEEFKNMAIGTIVKELMKFVTVRDVLETIKGEEYSDRGVIECSKCGEHKFTYKEDSYKCINCEISGNSIELYHYLKYSDEDYTNLLFNLSSKYDLPSHKIIEVYCDDKSDIDVEDIHTTTFNKYKPDDDVINTNLNKRFYKLVNSVINNKSMDEEYVQQAKDILNKFKNKEQGIKELTLELRELVTVINKEAIFRDKEMLKKYEKHKKQVKQRRIFEEIKKQAYNNNYEEYQRLLNSVKEDVAKTKQEVKEDNVKKIQELNKKSDGKRKETLNEILLHEAKMDKAREELSNGTFDKGNKFKNIYHLLAEVQEVNKIKKGEDYINISPYKDGVVLNDCTKCGNLRKILKYNKNYTTTYEEYCECVKFPFEFNKLNTLSKEFKPNMNLIKSYFSYEEYNFIKNTSIENLIRIYKETLPTSLQDNVEINQVLDKIVDLYRLFQFNTKKGLYIEDNHYLFNLPNSIYLTPVVNKIILSMLERNIMVNRYEDFKVISLKNERFIKDYLQQLQESDFNNERLIEEVSKNLISGNTGFNRINDNTDKGNRLYSKVIKEEFMYDDIIIIHLSDNLKINDIKGYKELINYCNKNNKLLITFSSIILSTVFLTTKDIRDYKSGKEVSIKFNSETRAVLNNYNYKNTLGKYYSSKFYKYGGTMNVPYKIKYLMEYDKKVYDMYKSEDNEYNIRYTQAYTCSRDIMYLYEEIKEVNKLEYNQEYLKKQLRLYLEGINIYNDVNNIDVTMYRLPNDKGKLEDVEKYQAEQEEYYRRKNKFDALARKEDEELDLEWEDIFNENTVYGDYYEDDYYGYYYEDEEEEEEEVVYEFDEDFNKFLEEQLEEIDEKEQAKILDLYEIDELLKLIE